MRYIVAARLSRKPKPGEKIEYPITEQDERSYQVGRGARLAACRLARRLQVRHGAALAAARPQGMGHGAGKNGTL